MAEFPLTVMVALSDAERAEELAHMLAEHDGMIVAMPSELETPGPVDVIVTDGEPLDGETPHVVLGEAVAAANVRAVLPLSADAALVGAAMRIAAAGYHLGNGEAGNGVDTLQAAPNSHSPIALTPREMETLSLLADGASNKVIARQLRISVHTAKFHVAAVLAKLHAQNRADAVAIGVRQGLLYL
jgi:DNA-binding CsgD family transcriptional regulator